MQQRLLAGGGFLVVLTVAGTLGYRLIEGWSFLDSLYMTVITLTSVGFREIEPPSPAGKLFTMMLALAGVGTLFYVATSVIGMVIEGQLRDVLGTRRMRNRIEHLKDHYLLCGFGRVGAEVARVFAERRVPFVVIDANSQRLQLAARSGYLVVEGDATLIETLELAGIRRARGLVAASDSDAGNTFITLSARALKPDLFIIARAGLPASERRLDQAGANRVVSPYVLAGRRMAFAALQPSLVEFFDAAPEPGRPTETILAELEIATNSPFVGQSIRQMFAGTKQTRILALATLRNDLLVGPDPNTVLQAGDRVIVMGQEAELERLGGAWMLRRPVVRGGPTLPSDETTAGGQT
jgi:voltage-gated potassium channel